MDSMRKMGAYTPMEVVQKWHKRESNIYWSNFPSFIFVTVVFFLLAISR